MELDLIEILKGLIMAEMGSSCPFLSQHCGIFIFHPRFSFVRGPDKKFNEQ